MKKGLLLIILVCFALAIPGQINIIGHNRLNNSPLPNVKMLIKSNGVSGKTITPKGADFRVQLEFGKNYQIFFKHSQSPLMYMEVIADNIPPDKYEYMMSYELNVPFVLAEDDDVDTTVFARPFHRVIFNGKSKMIDDSAYNNRFARNIIRKTPPRKDSLLKVNTDEPLLLVGKLAASANGAAVLGNVPVDLLGKNGLPLKSTFSSPSGLFFFSGVKAGEVSALQANHPVSNTPVFLFNSAGKALGGGIPQAGKTTWKLQQPETELLTDNQFTGNIGGKLVSSAPRSKKFFAGKNVYLCNRLNTVIRQTKTNILGTFVFEEIKPDHDYYIGVDHSELAPGEKLDLLSKDDRFIASLDSVSRGRNSVRISSTYNKVFNDLSISDTEVKMDVKATIFGDNVNNPIGKLKVILLNSEYQVIDSAITDDFGTFKFKYLPFLKRFYLSAENTDNILDVFQNILIYSSDDNLVKIMTHQKGAKFSYKPVNAELTRLRDIELEDPWLELIDKDTASPAKPAEKNIKEGKSITENILFENNSFELTASSREILDKVILVLSANKRLQIEIGAHTDSRGSTENNQKLSEKRAATVRAYILSAGIDSRRITARGYGESKLLNDCDDKKECGEAAHAINRRIEFKISGHEKK